MKFYPIDIKAADWKRLDQFADRTVFQTREWLQFVAESQNALPVLAELREKNDVIGYFSGLTFSKFGMKVLGSSFPGWTTPYIGFNLNPGIPRPAARTLQEHSWHALRDDHSGCRNGEVFFQLLSRAQSRIRQRNGNHVQTSRRRRARGHKDIYLRHQTEHFSGISFPGLRVRRFLSSERSAGHYLQS